MEMYEEINNLTKKSYKSNNTIEWDYILMNYKIPLSFIEKYHDKLDWTLISAHQLLTEEFIEKWKDKVEWIYISYKQKLSKEFIEKHKDEIYFDWLKYNVLTQSDIGKDWFIAYICPTTLDKSKLTKKSSYCYSFLSRGLYNVKVRIYYKDLITTGKCKKVEILRYCNSYKCK